jgi:DNA-binding transcriptional ArsR family regulator
MLLALRRGELCVCQITELFGLAPSTVSKHLSILYQAGLAESRKDGRWIYYRLPGKQASPAARHAIDWVSQSVNGDARAAEDAARLKKILQMDPVEPCKRQCRN